MSVGSAHAASHVASLAAFALALAACAGAAPPPAPLPPPVAPPPQVLVAPTRAAEDDEADRTAALVEATLKDVAALRGLPIRHAVKSKTLPRSAMIARIKEHVAKEMPSDVITAEGEFLAGLALVPPRYDFLAGSLALLEGQIAGFYEPADNTMYLVDDLGEAEAKETLAHELVHALQDQSFQIQRFLDFTPGQSDRTDAAHSVIEGDATSAMIDASAGPGAALQMSPALLRAALLVGMRLSVSGAETPGVIVASLMAPYADGFAFVDERRRAGGWRAVDAAFGAMPATTEQLLHPAKYAAREPAIAMPKIPVDALGAGFETRLDDDMGEQGLRIMLAAWAPNEVAARAAEGWGGDRMILADKREGARHTFAAAYQVRYDSPKLADGAAALLAAKFKPCFERPELGPQGWMRKGADIVIVGGPYTREGEALRPAGTCADATRWMKAILSR